MTDSRGTGNSFRPQILFVAEKIKIPAEDDERFKFCADFPAQNNFKKVLTFAGGEKKGCSACALVLMRVSIAGNDPASPATYWF